MEEMKRDETQRVYSLVGVLGITVLAFLMLVSIASANPYAYIPNINDNNLSVIDTVTNTVTSTVSVGNYPFGVAVTPDGKKVYVTGENVAVIDTATNKVIATIQAGYLSSSIAVNSAGTKAYLAATSIQSIYVINTTTNKITAQVNNLGNAPYGVAVSPDGMKVYVTIVNSKIVSVIDTATNTVTATVGVGSNPEGIAVSPDGTKVYVANWGSNSVSVIDTATNKVITTINVGYGSTGVAVIPDGTKIYVANANSDTVSVIDTATNTVTATVNGFSGPFGISATPDGKDIYVANRDGNTVSVIDTATNKVTATVHVGNEPLAFGQFIASVPAPAPIIPVANFSVNTTEGNAPLTIQFTDLSTNGTSVNWDFGDGNNSEERNPVHEFTTAGTYTVNFTAINENGTDSKLATINVTEKPIFPTANFSVNTTEGFAPLNVQFNDLSTNAKSVKWDFGDGNNSTERNPVHEYSNPGNYTVNLTAINGNGIDSKLATITVSEKPVPLVANFSASPTLGNAPLNVSFTDNSIGTPTAWNWNFGDRNNSIIQNPTHIYSKVGNYTVALTVSNAGGSNTATKTNYIKIIEPKPKPIAVFTASPTSGNVPLKVKFTDKSTGSPTSWSWNFGDGAYSTVKNPTYTYNEAGKYTVSLTVKNAAGTNTKTIANYITVNAASVKPVAAFTASPTSGKHPLTVKFTDKSTGSPTSWSWNFGDKSTSTVQSPTHKYTKAGKYTVTLTVKNAAGSNTKKVSNYITVK